MKCFKLVRRSFLVSAVAVAAAVACGTLACSSDSGPDNGGGGAAGTAAGGGGTGGGSGGGCSSNCDDGFNCTIDACVGDKCSHSIGPNTGSTACPTGQFCTADKGCVASPACATAADCTKVWSGDACKSNIKCDAASSVCTFDVLDKDGDKHAPQICGGGDCNDDDPNIHPGAKEICNGKDDDCDGVVDNEPAADQWCQSGQGVGYACQNGSCACKPDNLCGSSCVDKKTNIQNCGACGNTCPAGGTCSGGTCSCPSGSIDCAGSCVDTGTDPKNCGTCSHACSSNGACNGGICSCPSGTTDCGSSCVDTSADPSNCGTCGKACVIGGGCSGGTCSGPQEWIASMSGTSSFEAIAEVSGGIVFVGMKYDTANPGVHLIKVDSGGGVLWESLVPNWGYGDTTIQPLSNSVIIASPSTSTTGSAIISVGIADGSILWQELVPFVVWALGRTADGSLVVTSNSGNVSKLDAAGSVIWQKQVASSAVTAIGTSDGDILVGADNHLLKLDGNLGSVIWGKSFQAGTYPCDLDTVVEQGSGLALTCQVGSYSPSVLKTDSQGNILWQKNWGGAPLVGLVATNGPSEIIVQVNSDLVDMNDAGGILWQRSFGAYGIVRNALRTSGGKIAIVTNGAAFGLLDSNGKAGTCIGDPQYPHDGSNVGMTSSDWVPSVQTTNWQTQVGTLQFSHPTASLLMICPK